MTASLEDLMEAAKRALQQARTATGADAERVANDFGAAVGGIGRRLYVAPENADKVRAFVADTAEAILRPSAIWLWVSSVVNAAEPFNAEPALYVQALNMRSDLEFFRDLYRDSAARERLQRIEMEDTDADLERLAPHYYIDKVPDDIPPHHVWWQRHFKAPLRSTRSSTP